MDSMQENEFEKVVQQKMEVFKLNPSDAVWSKVSATLTKPTKPHKKILLFFMFLCFLVVATTFVPVINTKHYFKDQTGHLLIQTDKPKTKDSKATAPAINNESEKSSVEMFDPETKKNANNTVSKDLATRQAPVLVQVVTTSDIKSSLKKIKNGAGKKIIKIAAGSVGENADLINNENEKVTQVFTEEKKNFSTSKLKDIQITDSLINPVLAKKLNDTAKNKSLLVVKNIKNSKNKWKLGITLAIGKSATGNGYLISGNDRSYNYSSYPQSSAGSNTGYRSIAINSGIAFSAGIFATHKLGSKTNIMVGLNYKLFRTSIIVGKQITGNNNIVYETGNTKTYYNNYHFAELPITFQMQFISIKKRPVFLDAGISVAQLIQTNALQFDPAQTRYFIDNNLFHKTIIGFSAGLSFNIASKKSTPFLLGPQIYYSATPLANKGLYTNSRYSFAGIRLQKIIK